MNRSFLIFQQPVHCSVMIPFQTVFDCHSIIHNTFTSYEVLSPFFSACNLSRYQTFVFCRQDLFFWICFCISSQNRPCPCFSSSKDSRRFRASSVKHIFRWAQLSTGPYWKQCRSTLQALSVLWVRNICIFLPRQRHHLCFLFAEHGETIIHSWSAELTSRRYTLFRAPVVSKAVQSSVS